MRWIHEIVAWHRAKVTNGPTEAMNNLIKRIKRVAFGLVSFRNYRTRALLYAGKPNWSRLATVCPRKIRRAPFPRITGSDVCRRRFILVLSSKPVMGTRTRATGGSDQGAQFNGTALFPKRSNGRRQDAVVESLTEEKQRPFYTGSSPSICSFVVDQHRVE